MNDSGLKHYLSQLNDAPLLTRAEEDKLLKNIEKKQAKIMQVCVSSDFFKAELLDLLKSKNVGEIVNLSRKLTDRSSKADIKKMKALFYKLVEDLQKPRVKKTTLQKTLNQIAFSGTIVHALVTRVKRKYKQVEEAEDRVQSLKKYFEVRTQPQLRKKVREIQEDPTVLEYYVRKTGQEHSRVLSKAHEYLEHLAHLKKLQTIGVEPKNFKEIKSLYKSLLKTESEMADNKNELVRKNLRLVVSRAKKLTNRGLEFEELIQEGSFGLIKAVDKHDSSRGTKLSTHATWWIDQSIRRAISNKSRTVRVPTHIESLQMKIGNAVSELSDKLNRAPKKEELAKFLDINVSVLEDLEKRAIHKVGIEDEVASGVSLLEVLPSDSSNNPMSVASQKHLREKVRQILATLSPRTEKIIRLRFGIGEPQQELTLSQIADSVGLSRMGVKVVEGKGVSQIKEQLGESDD